MRFLVIALLVALSGCSRFAPDAGHEIVLVQKPWFFGHGGIVREPVTTGLTFGAFTTKGILVNMQPQQFELDLPDTMTSDGVPISFHAIMLLQVVDSVKLIETFGPNWYQHNLAAPFGKMVRQAVRKHGMNETAISAEAIESIDAEIHASLASFIEQKGLPVKLITLTVGKANPPDSVKNQRIETAAQQQRIQTEQQKKLAEDQRKRAEESRAAADNAYREAMHLSPEQFIQLETIKMQAQVCGSDGKATCTFIQNGALPVHNLGR
jgi:regulator of protease activity HflC (stomatin/prohibitin superfamily)